MLHVIGDFCFIIYIKRKPNVLLRNNSFSHNDVNQMLQSTQSADLNPDETVWEILGQCVRQCSLAPPTKTATGKIFSFISGAYPFQKHVRSLQDAQSCSCVVCSCDSFLSHFTLSIHSRHVHNRFRTFSYSHDLRFKLEGAG